jgi:hypothetical protein
MGNGYALPVIRPGGVPLRRPDGPDRLGLGQPGRLGGAHEVAERVSAPGQVTESRRGGFIGIRDGAGGHENSVATGGSDRLDRDVGCVFGESPQVGEVSGEDGAAGFGGRGDDGVHG